jgi:hypothetical protein
MIALERRQRAWYQMRDALWRHAHSARFLFGKCSPWILLAPLISAIATWLSLSTPWHAWFEKPAQEVFGPAILAMAVILSLRLYKQHPQTFSKWLVWLTGALFCRELHFAGTNNGIYVALVVLLWFASRNLAAMRPWLDSRTIVSLFAAALWTYLVAKTLDRGYWKSLPDSALWRDHLEETLESAGHLLILVMVVCSDRLIAGARTKPVSNGDWWLRSLPVWAAVLAGVGSAAALYGSHYAPAPPAQRGPRALPFELSSICPVSPKLGQGLFLASSDEQRKLALWHFDEQGRPVCLGDLDLAVPREGGELYRLHDIEDLAWDGEDRYYAITSHRRLVAAEDDRRMAKHGGTECALVSFQLQKTDYGLGIRNPQTVSRSLLERIRKLEAFSSIQWDRNKSFRWRHLGTLWQVDIEAITCVADTLLLGFKNPVEAGRATILGYSLHDGALRVVARPNLRGQGITGLCYDRDADRLVALSNHPWDGHFEDSCVWVGVRTGDTGDQWLFPPEPNHVIERTSRGRQRKASGLTLWGGRLLVCFDETSAATVELLPRHPLLSEQPN